MKGVTRQRIVGVIILIFLGSGYFTLYFQNDYQNSSYLGFQIPSWRIREIEAMFGKSWHKLVKRYCNPYWPERGNVRGEQ